MIDGEARTTRIRDDLLTARFIAACIQDQRGERRREHPLFAKPIAIDWSAKLDCPLFIFEEAAYAVEGDARDPLLIEIVLHGPLSRRRTFDPLGRRLSDQYGVRGRAEWN
jgi:hypothetical protein